MCIHCLIMYWFQFRIHPFVPLLTTYSTWMLCQWCSKAFSLGIVDIWKTTLYIHYRASSYKSWYISPLEQEICKIKVNLNVNICIIGNFRYRNQGQEYRWEQSSGRLKLRRLFRNITGPDLWIYVQGKCFNNIMLIKLLLRKKYDDGSRWTQIQ